MNGVNNKKSLKDAPFTGNPNMVKVPLKKINVYPDSHKGSVIVEDVLNKEYVKRGRSQKLNCGAFDLNPRGFCKAEVCFRNKDDANKFVAGINLTKNRRI